jgi:carbon monoxide dehydrogenase subunit G
LIIWSIDRRFRASIEVFRSRMELNGEVMIEAPRERVWEALNDPVALQACIPGCEEVVDESPTVRRARVMVKVGPVRARFNGRVTLSEIEPPERCVMSFEGSGGAAGMASGHSKVELHEESAGTRLTYTVKASVGGKLGQIGGRMMDASAKQLADQFFQALRARMAAPAEAAPPGGAAPETHPELAPNAPGSAATAVMAGPAAAVTRILLDDNQRQTPVSPVPPARVAPPAPVATLPEKTRVLWFLLGVGATAFGVWLGTFLR